MLTVADVDAAVFVPTLELAAVYVVLAVVVIALAVVVTDEGFTVIAVVLIVAVVTGDAFVFTLIGAPSVWLHRH